MTLHHITTKALLRVLPDAPLTKLDTIVAVLLQRRLVSTVELIDALWGDDENGGPDDARSVLKQHVWKLRHYYGCEISANYGRGYSLWREER